MVELAVFVSLTSALAPANPGMTAPPGAIGFPSRAPGLDALPGFVSPPPGYGEVGFFWWLGDPLTRERLEWQLDRLEGKGAMGLQVNYAHSDRGGVLYGLTYPSDPPLFSKEWWDLFGWFLKEAKSRGMAVSLSDYTLGVGQGWAVDEALAKHPEINGWVLRHEARDSQGGANVEWLLPDGLLALQAYRLGGDAVVPGDAEDLLGRVREGKLDWRAPEGTWRIDAVWAERIVPSIDPMNADSGASVIEAFFEPFEAHNPGEAGRGLDFFFSDELAFRVSGWLYDEAFAREFRRRKGYDVRPELPALFVDIGPRTPKVRLDYSDVMVALSEEGYFRPIFEWHQRRGMIYGCDHGGRGYDVTEFGDYFRTQRWNQGPGCDQPGLAKDLVKNKVASSIAHLYERPRVWLEGYHSSGWGTSSAQIADATFANFAMGQNLLTLHGLYYSTHGGWWEWAPPDNHWRMPYWTHIDTFMGCVQRLSYLLSQGVHVCDVAVMYPVAPKEAGMGGAEAVEAAFDLGRRLYGEGIDFDFMDFESLDRARITDGRLNVAGESYRVLVLPAMQAVRHSTVERAAEFAAHGGIVVALGDLPVASDRVGRDDPEVDHLVTETFGIGAAEAKRLTEPHICEHAGGGTGLVSPDADSAIGLISQSFPQDIAAGRQEQPFYFMHRRIGPRDVYALYNLPKGAECTLRATGRAEMWDPWTGGTRPLAVLGQADGITRLRLPGEREEMQIVVFSPGEPLHDGGSPEPTETIIPIDGPWACELAPTLDNRFGDFRWPPSEGKLGPEVRRFRYVATDGSGFWRPDLDDSAWPRVTAGYGPMFLRLGPIPADADLASIEEGILDSPWPAAGRAQSIGDRQLTWQPYEFSWRWGVEGDPGHQGYHGLKEELYADFIRLGRLRDAHTSYVREPEDSGTVYYLWTTVRSAAGPDAVVVSGGMRPSAAWANGQPLPPDGRAVMLEPGANALLLRYDQPGTGYFILAAPDTAAANASFATAAFSLNARWIWASGDRAAPACTFRKLVELDHLAERASVHITCDNGYTLYVNGQQVGAGRRWETVQSYDVRALLQRGRNVIVVEAVNDGGPAGLIAEFFTSGGLRVGTDATWRCSTEPSGDWRGIAFDDSAWAGAADLGSFENSLWYSHPNGPPQLDRPEPVPGPTPGVLAMPWYGLPGILPFDVRPLDASPVGWYRFRTPPGMRAMTVTAYGRVRAWIDGRLVEGRRIAAKGPAVVYRFELRTPQAPEGLAALRVQHERGRYGGAALPEPVTFECGEGSILPGDWSKMESVESYSGGMSYRRTAAVSAEQLSGSVLLDLGQVVSSAEVHVNGKPAGTRVAPPWRWDVTKLLHPGENEVRVLVYNTLANHYLTIPTRYRGSATSGLIGPVVLRVR